MSFKINFQLTVVCVAMLVATTGQVQAGIIGILSSNGSAHSRMATAAAVNGDTSAVIGNLATDDLTAFDAVWLLENINSGSWTSFIAGSANVNSYVSNGGALFFNDRSVGNNGTTQQYLAPEQATH